MSLWYYQSGSSSGKMEVLLFTDGNLSKMFEIDGDHGSNWNKLTLDIGNRKTGFQVTRVIR